MNSCGCTPGTYEGGWHEERSEACQRAESEAFARSLDAGYRWARGHLLSHAVGVGMNGRPVGDILAADEPPLPADVPELE